MREIEALREINFDWTMHVRGIWTDSRFSSSRLNQPFREEILRDFDRLGDSREELSPLGRVILGPAGSGKTHFIGELRREIFKRSAGFILVDMTDVNDFLETVVLGYLGSLQQPYRDGKTQSQAVFHHLLGMVKVTLGKERLTSEELVKKLPGLKKPYLNELRAKIISLLRQKYPRETIVHQDVIRAFLLFNSHDSMDQDIGYLWLQGQTIDKTDKKNYGFGLEKGKHADIIRGLSWLMNLKFPVLLALDQFDAIVAEHSFKCANGEDDPVGNEQNRSPGMKSPGMGSPGMKSLGIVEKIAGGLMALRDITVRTLTVAACLETTWEFLRTRALKSSTDRFRAPYLLGPISRAEVAEKIVGSRLADSYGRIKFTPPYPTWPIKPAAFETAKELFPREILKRCDNFRQHCLNTNTMYELESFTEPLGSKDHSSGSPEVKEMLDQTFRHLYKTAPVMDILNQDNEDLILKNIIQAACRCLIKESVIPDNVDVIIETQFPGGSTYRTLHGRISIIYRDQGDRERHFCVRGLQKNNSRSFQARFKAAVIESGMDSGFKFRHLLILRQGKIPSGEKTLGLLDRFKSSGGTLNHLSESEVRSFWALSEMEKKKTPGFESWLFRKKIVSKTSHFKLVLAWLANKELSTVIKTDPMDLLDRKQGKLTVLGPTGPDNARLDKVNMDKARLDQPGIKSGSKSGREQSSMGRVLVEQEETKLFLDIPVGVMVIGRELGHGVSIPVSELTKHTALLAGTGAGKTVLVKRIVEEAAIRGIPSIVLDCANDLATLSDKWPETPGAWSENDKLSAAAYHKRADVVLWTPGRVKGNPLVCQYLPDIELGDDPDGLKQVLRMVWASLRQIAAPGTSAGANKRSGVLFSALEYFAENGWGDLDGFINLLSDLPSDAGGGISRCDKLAQEMADSLKARVQTDPMMGHSGTVLDPSILFGSMNPEDKTRISVINLAGLCDLGSQQQFVNQLSINLFTWIKKNPAPIRGLLVIDEAKDFIPSSRSTLCSQSILRLCAQARKYGLGLVFATQEPKSMDHNVIANCSNQFYGRANSLAAIEAVREQIRLRGGSGKGIPTLLKGEFYLSSEKIKPPVKIKVPLCLSYHSKNPLKEEELLQRGQVSRKKIEGFHV